MSDYYTDMFRIPFLHVEVRNWNIKKQRLKALFSFDNQSSEYHYKDITTDYYYKINNFNSDEVKISNEKVNEILLEEIEIFKSFFQLDNHKIILNWFQKSLPGQYHEVHNHGSYGYTAVCYIDYDERVHQPTKFIAPFNHFLKGDTLNFVPENIKEGSLIFFPSSINHYSSPNHSETSRTILSMNIKVQNKSDANKQNIFDTIRP